MAILLTHLKSFDMLTNMNVCDLNIFFYTLLGLRGSITLLNKRNYPAEFSWSPVVDEKGTAFSIRPSIGRRDKIVLTEYIEICTFFSSEMNCTTVYNHAKKITSEKKYDKKREN